MIPINYHQLYYFWTVAKAGSIKAAGDKLLLAVSTISLQLTQLERAVNVKLLNRTRRGISLTAEGKIIYERCERIFTDGDELALMLSKDKSKIPAILRLGVQNTVSPWIALKLIKFIETGRKNIRVNVFGGTHADLQERLQRYDLDIVLSNLDYSNYLGRDFESRLAGKVPITFVGTPAFRKLIKIFPADLEKVPLIMPTAEHPSRKSIESFFIRNKLRTLIEAEIENPMMIRHLAREGHGIAIIDAVTVKKDMEAGTLIQLHPQPVGIEEYIWLLYNSRAKVNHDLDAMLQKVAAGFKI